MDSKCNCAEPMNLTMEEWKKKHRDFKSINHEDGKIRRSALRLCHVHGTTSETVTIVKET